MARVCPRCSEPLLGAVNRCWKCGLDVRGETQPGASPQSLQAHEPILVAELSDSSAAETTSDAPPKSQPEAQPAAAPGPLVAPAESPTEYQVDGSTLRRGSPFSAGAVLLPPRSAPAFGAAVSPATQVSNQQRYASDGGVVAALVLGLFGLLLAPFRFEGAIVGLLGLVMGLWGLYSKRRQWALFGLILCCLAVGIGCYTGAYWLFRYVNHSTPWEY